MSRKLLSGLMLITILLNACAPAATPQPIAPSAPTAQPTAVPTIAPTTAPTEPPAPTAAATPAPIKLTDGLGRSIELAAPAQRIVSIAPSNTEILFALGAGQQIVGREEMSDYPAEAKNVTSIGSVFQKINTEAIVALQPDLILAAEINSPEQVKALEDLKLNVYYLSNPKTFDELYANLETVGKLTGRSAEAAKLNESLKARYATVIQKVSQAKAAPTVFYEIDATDPTKPYTSGPGTFIDLVITLAGGKNIGGALKDAFAQISSEELVKQNPDLVVLGDALYGVTPESVGQRPGWSALNAVKNKQVFAFDDNLISRPGPRLIDGLEQMAKLIHPELFK
jgi:iron complex transport system substrate-binding protein